MPNDPMSMGSQKKSPNKAPLIAGIALILLLLGGVYYWFMILPNTRTTSPTEENKILYSNAKTEITTSLSPLYGKVEIVTDNTITVKEIQMPLPGESIQIDQTNSKTYVLKIASSTSIKSTTKNSDGSFTDKPSTIKDIKKGDYIMTSAINSSLTQPLEVSSIQFSSTNPF